MLSLLSLPLVLVQDILEFVVLSVDLYRDEDEEIEKSMNLRAVNRLFEHEITKYFARSSLDDLDHDQATRMLPDFKVRLLREYIGEELRRDGSRFARHVHEVVEILDNSLVPSEHPGDRSSLLSDVCETFVRFRHDWYTLGSICVPELHDAKETVFLIAILSDYVKLQSHMIRNESASASTYCRYLGCALTGAIRHGRLNAVILLDPEGTQIVLEDNYEHWNGDIHRALRSSVRAGYLETLRWVLPHLHVIGPPYESICYDLFETAAIHNQPEIACHILFGRYRLPWDEVNPLKALSWLCRYGHEDLVRHIAGLNLLPTLDSSCMIRRKSKKVPLEEAAAAGHYSICRFLLDQGKAGGDLRRRPSTLFQAAIQSGDVAILRLFEDRGLGKVGKSALASALPAAAARGHLEMAKYVVGKKYDAGMSRKYACWLDTETIRSWALMRAVLGHHTEMIRWLVEDLGTHMDVPRRVWERGVNPLDIAIAMGKVDIVKLLLRLGATPTEDSLQEPESFMKGRDRYTAREAFEHYRCFLNMVPDRSLKLEFGSKKKIAEALGAVDADVYGIVRLFEGVKVDHGGVKSE